MNHMKEGNLESRRALCLFPFLLLAQKAHRRCMTGRSLIAVEYMLVE